MRSVLLVSRTGRLFAPVPTSCREMHSNVIGTPNYALNFCGCMRGYAPDCERAFAASMDVDAAFWRCVLVMEARGTVLSRRVNKINRTTV